MKLLTIAAALLLAHQGQSSPVPPRMIAPPPPPERPADPPPPSQAQVERFLASLPKDAQGGRFATPDPEAVKRLVGQSPGKEAQIAAILAGFGKCAEPAAAAGMQRVHRRAAQSPNLGAEKIERLIEFFGGPGWGRLKAVGDRIGKSSTPDPADIAERDRLTADYPLEDFNVAITVAALHSVTEGAFADVKACEARRDEALTKAGIAPLGSVFRR